MKPKKPAPTRKNPKPTMGRKAPGYADGGMMKMERKRDKKC